MNVKHIEIRDYLSHCTPLKGLNREQLAMLADSVEIIEIESHSVVLNIGENNDFLYLTRTGAIELQDSNNVLFSRNTEGEWFGYRSVLRGGKVRYRATTLEDSVLYRFPGEMFLQLLEEHNTIRQFFSEKARDRLRGALNEVLDSNEQSMASLQVSDLMKPPLLIPQASTIQQVAQSMNTANVNTALITDNDDTLCGIVTDLDFRQQVVAEGRDICQPIATIMTTAPVTLGSQARASEALLLMARRNIRHIPVINQDDILGVISATDLLRSQSHHAIYLVGDISAAESVEQLAQLSKELPKIMVSLVRNSLTASDIGHAISSIGEAIICRLLKLAERQFGPPPIDYAYIIAGSMARSEQTAHTDQDNGMILSDEYDEALHGEYFRNVAKLVSDGQDRCGYIYCPGDVMATNDKWRQPLKVWRNYFDHWINSPEPKALMYASIFFDLRCVYGDASLLSQLQQKTLETTSKQGLFQAHMAGNSLSHRPPLGFFRGFVLEKDAESNNEKGMNMKKRGVVPVIDIARTYALAGGLDAINTRERLSAIAANDLITAETIEDLQDAFEFISTVRLQHQANQIENDQPPTNYVPPETLSALERRHLKDAFEVISTVQESMLSRFHANHFR